MVRRAPLTLVLVALLAACGGGTDDRAQTAPAADLAPVKQYLVGYTGRLTAFTARFGRDSARYHALVRAAGSDRDRLWSTRRDEVQPLLASLKDAWVAGNPLYERVEGIVAGTPSLSRFDVILDAGASAAEDPQSAVPFDLRLADGRVLRRPGNLYNLTEGALWGTLPASLGAVASTPADLDGDGRTEFGEVLPDAAFLRAAAEAFDRYARELDAAARAWSPEPSDAMTALVVMVPTMSEYFGQWKESRFVRGDAAASEAFNVVSRLSDVGDILRSLEVIYDGVLPLTAQVGADRSRQTRRALADLRTFVHELRARENRGTRFTPDQAETLAAEAQSRASAIAGQVSQQAAELRIPIEQ